jgi:hypothetical protein
MASCKLIGISWAEEMRGHNKATYDSNIQIPTISTSSLKMCVWSQSSLFICALRTLFDKVSAFSLSHSPASAFLSSKTQATRYGQFSGTETETRREEYKRGTCCCETGQKHDSPEAESEGSIMNYFRSRFNRQKSPAAAISLSSSSSSSSSFLVP